RRWERGRPARFARQFDALRLSPPAEAGGTPALPGSHVPAFRLEALFTAGAAILQKFGHGPIRERRFVLERTERFEPVRDARVSRPEATEKSRPERRPHTVVVMNDPGRPQFVLAIPLLVDGAAHLVVVAVGQLLAAESQLRSREG